MSHPGLHHTKRGAALCNMQTQEDNKYHYSQQWERHCERRQQWSSYITKLIRIRREGKEKWGIFIEQGQRNALCNVLLFNVFFSPFYNHTFALTFYVYLFTTETMFFLCFFITTEKMLFHVCACALLGWGLGNNNNLTRQNMFALSYYFLMRVWQTQNLVS